MDCPLHGLAVGTSLKKHGGKDAIEAIASSRRIHRLNLGGRAVVGIFQRRHESPPFSHFGNDRFGEPLSA